EGHFVDWPLAARDYAEAFREAGLGEPGDETGVVAARIKSSGVSGPLIAALDDWASIAQERETVTWLLEVARAADPDPWRDRFRDPEVRKNRQALQALADEVLQGDGARLDELTPQALVSLSLLLGEGVDALPLLLGAQRHHPSDFWVNVSLGIALNRMKKV